MTANEDEFRPSLGRMRARGQRASKRYLAKLYATMEKAHPGAFAKRAASKSFGSRIGRGSGHAAGFAVRRDAFAGSRMRRVVVKIRSVRLGGSGLPKARAHLSYIQRDGADRDGNRGQLYGPTEDAADAKAFLDEGSKDRHHFRVIVSPEDGAELSDLRDFTRDLMAAAEGDLGTKLDWVAANHFNTDHPHVHIVLRGKTDDGKDLVIARNYITMGFRHRAEEIASAELGPRSDVVIARAMASEVEKERYTGLDHDLQSSLADGVVRFGPPRTVYDAFRQKLFRARLRTLEGMRLAERGPDGWRLAPELEATLKEAGKRGDIIRSMGAELGEKLAPATVREFARDRSAERIIGRVAGAGPIDDDHDRRFLAVEGADGYQWHIETRIAPGAAPPEGAIIEASRPADKPRSADLVVAAIAERHSGVYSDALHAAEDPRAGADYRLAHQRRLEALRRSGIVDREMDGTWRVPGDFLKRAAAYEREKSGARIRTLSWVALDQAASAQAVTFLDDALESRIKIERVPHGFGADLEEALATRRRWLLSQGFGREGEEGFSIDRDRLRDLSRAAMEDAAARLAKDLGKDFAAVVDGARIEGMYRRPIDLPAGRFAIIERSKEFTLVPWREVLEQRRGMEISGFVRGGGVTWEFGKRRSGPTI